MSRLSPLLEDAARSSAAPAAVRLVVEQLQEAGRGEALENADVAASVAAVAAASRSLGRFLVAEPAALEALAVDGGASFSDIDDAAALALAQRLAFLRIARDDLVGSSDLAEVGTALARLADDVFTTAVRLVTGGEVGLAVVAMGKHGAEELNYASDVDVVFVADDGEDLERATRAAQGVLGLVRASYRVDVDLRPEGRNGALVRSLSSYRAYWEAWARPWEFQALLKQRPCAGGPSLQAAFAAAAEEAVWSRRLDADALAELRAMKGRAEAAVVARGLGGRELKRGRGGIRDVEFAVQLLQLVHGGSDPALRRRATLAALSVLANGYVDPGDAATLSLAYRFLRTLEHRLQLVEEAQVHTVPPPGPQRAHVARVLGFPAETTRRSGRFETVLAGYQAAVRSIHERLFFRPLLEAFSSGPARRLSEVAASERLAAFGFHDAERTRQALDELTRGLTRSSRLMGQLLPVLLGWLSETPDPDLGLLGLRNLAGLKHQRDVVVGAFRDSPELARRLCVVLGTGRRVGELVIRHPSLALRIGADAELEAGTAEDLSARAQAALASAPGGASGRLRLLVSEETLRIAAGDLVAGLPTSAVGAGLSRLGGAALTAALAAARPGLPFALVAVGRLGGGELAYGSDLDVLFVYDGSGPLDAEEAERVASFVLGVMNGPTPAERIWTVDASLRPEGKHGVLARSLAGYEEYHSRWISPWERQALVRARPLAGDAEVSATFMSLVRRSVWEHELGEDEVREIRRLKARTEKERIPAGEDPQFHFKLGRGSLADIEWTVQLLQLTCHVEGPSTARALEDLAGDGALTQLEAAVLAEALAHLEATRNRWHLVGNYLAGAGGPVSHHGSDSLPSSIEGLSRLARSLGETPTAVRERYRRVTRRARRVVERRFYGL